MSKRVVIGGPRNCGKSTLAASLFKQLTAAGADVSLFEIDTFSDTVPCILGIKPWTERKKRKAGNWDDPLIDVRLREFASNRSRIVIGDLPGVIDGLLVKMVGSATHAIVIAKDWASLTEWEEFFCRQNIPIILRVISHMGQLPLLPISLDAIHVQGLDRKVHLNGEVSRVARQLAEICGQSFVSTITD